MGNDERQAHIMNIKYWLWLVMVFGAGNPHIWRVVKAAGSAEHAYECLISGAVVNVSVQTERERHAVESIGMEQVERVLEDCRKKNISVMSCEDDDYPDALRCIYNAPAVLFYKGDLSVLDCPTLTVVGTKKASDYSLRACEHICKGVAAAGITIVSGFAVGLDTAANQAALEAENGKAAAFLPCGIDYNYPKENIAFKAEMEEKALLITEFLPGTPAHLGNFPLRNRLMAGISYATLVIQAPENSRALVTASMALEKGKKLFCVPPTDIFDKNYTGVVKYLREGASCAFSSLDIINAYYEEYAHEIKASVVFQLEKDPDESPVFDVEYGINPQKPVKSKNVEKPEMPQNFQSPEKPKARLSRVIRRKKNAGEAKQERDISPKGRRLKTHAEKRREKTEINSSVPQMKSLGVYEELSERERAVVDLLLEKHALHVDEITDAIDMFPDETASVLTELCIKGMVFRRPGNVYEILKKGDGSV